MDHPGKVVTRFAPSPTGYLHIGGARTAVFNWAFARHHGGSFILRLEDTDQQRSTPESTRRILEDLAWLGIDWDQGPRSRPRKPSNGQDSDWDPYQDQVGTHGPYFQSQRLDLYRDFITQLINEGRAYKCFKTPEQLGGERRLAASQKRPYKYDPTEALNRSSAEIAQLEAQGKPCVVRFRMPDCDVTVDDLVLGPVTVKAPELEDFIILKSDGYPTFHLANVVDDYLMEVTHVLRAQEHLMNTPKHVALQDAFGFPRPAYAHMPLIFNPDATKMSKRDKAKAIRAAAAQALGTGKKGGLTPLWAIFEGKSIPLTDAQKTAIEDFLAKKNDSLDDAAPLVDALDVSLPEIDVHDFRASGYLPGVVVNYIALLGWSPGNDVEYFGQDPLAFLRQHFDLGHIGKANARFDREKLRAFNTDALLKLDPTSFKDLLHDFGADFYPLMTAKLHDQFDRFSESYRPRCRTLAEPFLNGRFLIVPDDALTFDAQAVQKVLAKSDGEGYGVLRRLEPILAQCEPWSPGEIEKRINNFAGEASLGLGKVAQPLRVAVTGSTVSPPIYDTLVMLGQPSTLARVRRCLAAAGY